MQEPLPGPTRRLETSMIIDCHTHFSTYTNEGLSFAQIKDRLLTDMERNGIDFSCVLPDSESGSAVADLDTTLELTAASPRLFALGTVLVSSIDAAVLEKIEKLAAARSIIGIKLYPGFEEFYPDDECCYPLYDICRRYALPVLFHSGETLQERWREEFNHPWEIARLAENCPDLNIIIAHFSQPHLEACRDILFKIPNVCADISSLAHPTTTSVCGRDFIRQVLEETVKKSPEKVLFGTDWPICDVTDHIKLVESLDITDESKELVFSGNAGRLFGL